MLSQKFITDCGSNFIVAPLICYELKEADCLVPITPMAAQVFNMIVNYSGSLFTSEQQFKRYVINHLKEDGTEIFVTHLRNPNQAALHNELTCNLEANDIIVSKDCLEYLGMSEFHLFEHSLSKLINFLYI